VRESVVDHSTGAPESETGRQTQMHVVVCFVEDLVYVTRTD
jgi:hypothetical protein